MTKVSRLSASRFTLYCTRECCICSCKYSSNCFLQKPPLGWDMLIEILQASWKHVTLFHGDLYQGLNVTSLVSFDFIILTSCCMQSSWDQSKSLFPSTSCCFFPVRAISIYINCKLLAVWFPGNWDILHNVNTVSQFLRSVRLMNINIMILPMRCQLHLLIGRSIPPSVQSDIEIRTWIWTDVWIVVWAFMISACNILRLHVIAFVDVPQSSFSKIFSRNDHFKVVWWIVVI